MRGRGSVTKKEGVGGGEGGREEVWAGREEKESIAREGWKVGVREKRDKIGKNGESGGWGKKGGRVNGGRAGGRGGKETG